MKQADDSGSGARQVRTERRSGVREGRDVSVGRRHMTQGGEASSLEPRTFPRRLSRTVFTSGLNEESRPV